MSAFGTLSLAIFTVLSLLEAREQTKERMNEQDKYLEKRILSEVNSLLNRIDENENTLYDPGFEWAAPLDVFDSEEVLYLDLSPLEIAHPTVAGRFEEEYTSAHDSVETYNDLLYEVDSSAAQIVYESSGYISECINSFEISDSEGNLVSTEDALSLVLSGKEGIRGPPADTDPDWWSMEDVLREQVRTCVDGELDDFYAKKQALEVQSSKVADELDSVRDYIIDEYPLEPLS